MSSASEALAQLSQLSKTIGLCAQETDQLRTDNTRLHLLLRTRTDELNASLNENKVLRERCLYLENQLRKFNTNQEMKILFESENSWDSQSEEYLANVSNEDLLAGIEYNSKINSSNGAIRDKPNEGSVNEVTNANKRLKTSDHRNNNRIETEPIASTSSADTNHGLNAIKVDNKMIANYSNGNRITDRKETTVKSNVSQVLTKFIASTSKQPNTDSTLTLSPKFEDRIKITIYLSQSGRKLLFQVNCEDYVSSLRRKLQEREGYPCAGHRLVFGGQLLKDDSRLSHFKIKNGSVIYCYTR